MAKTAKRIAACVTVLLCAVVLYLTLLSMFSTSYILAGERVLYTKDTPLLHLGLFAALSALAAFLYKYRAAIKRSRTGKASGTAIALTCLAALTWVLFTRPTQDADQYAVMAVAAALREGDGSSLLPGGYMDMCQQQVGMVLLAWLLSFPFGTMAFLPMQLLNVAALGACTIAITRMAQEEQPHLGFPTTLATIAFLPLMGYVTFVYGSLPGLALALWGCERLLHWLRSPRPSTAAVGCLLLALAAVVKMNYLIWLIAAALVLLWQALRSRSLHPLPVALALVVAFLLAGFLAKTGLEAIAGVTLGPGVPKSVWAAMGLQEGPHAPGWYNNYPEGVYITSGYDTAATGEAAIRDIQGRIEEFMRTPFYGLQFFGLKTASQWNDPTFQGLWVTATKGSAISQGPLATWLLHGNGAAILFKLMDLFQTQALLGTLFWALSRKKKAGAFTLLCALTFLGGFFFHLVWEAKGQYTMPFFLMLLPLAVHGWAAIGKTLHGLTITLHQTPKGHRFKTLAQNYFSVTCAALLTLVLFLSLTNRQVLAVTLKPGGDEPPATPLYAAYQIE